MFAVQIEILNGQIKNLTLTLCSLSSKIVVKGMCSKECGEEIGRCWCGLGDLYLASGLVRKQLSVVRISITQTVAEAFGSVCNERFGVDF